MVRDRRPHHGELLRGTGHLRGISDDAVPRQKAVWQVVISPESNIIGQLDGSESLGYYFEMPFLTFSISCSAIIETDLTLMKSPSFRGATYHEIS